MDEISREKTLEKLTKAESVLVAVSDAYGFDAAASGLALSLALIKLGKSVSVVAKEPSVGDAQKLYGVDNIGKTAGRKNLVVVVNNAVDSVDKVTYFLDQNRLKVVIHPLAGAPPILRENIAIEESVSLPELIFCVGFSSPEELYSKITLEQNITPQPWIVNITRDLPKQKFAQVDFSIALAAGISEVTARLIQNLALPIDEDIAYNLYMGLCEATEQFSPAKITAGTFETAEWLVKFGAGKASFAKRTARSTIDSQTGFPLIDIDRVQTLEELESKQEHKEPRSSEWLAPPKIYKGAKSFDKEN